MKYPLQRQTLFAWVQATLVTSYVFSSLYNKLRPTSVLQICIESFQDLSNLGGMSCSCIKCTLHLLFHWLQI